MRTGKFQKITKKKRNNSTKIVTILLALALLVCCGIGGTVAWLMDSTEAVTNTFTIGDINLTLVESPYNAANNSYDEPDENVNNSYPLIPGNSYKKDPKVTVLANSEDCYLFVRMEKIGNPDNYLDFTFNDDGWSTYNGEEGVYYREVLKNDSVRSWDLLTASADSDGNTYTIAVKKNIVKKGSSTDTDTIEMPDTTPKLVFTAYAVQKANLSLEEAWAQVDPTPAGNN